MHPRIGTRLIAATAAFALTAATVAACSSSDSSDTAAAGQGSSSLSGVTLTLGDQVSALKTLLTASGELSGTAYTVKFAESTSGPPSASTRTPRSSPGPAPWSTGKTA
jgi:hypothetical protein